MKNNIKIKVSLTNEGSIKHLHNTKSVFGIAVNAFKRICSIIVLTMRCGLNWNSLSTAKLASKS